MGQMPAFGQAHAHDRVARLEKSQKHRFVGRRPAMGLHIGGIGAKELFDPLNGQLFGDIDIFTAAVIAFAGIALGVFVGQL